MEVRKKHNVAFLINSNIFLDYGDRIIDSPEQLDLILSAIAGGILKSPDKGRLTQPDHVRTARRRHR